MRQFYIAFTKTQTVSTELVEDNKKRLGKSYNMVNAYVQNRQQPRLEVLYEIAEILEIDVKQLLQSNKVTK